MLAAISAQSRANEAVLSADVITLSSPRQAVELALSHSAFLRSAAAVREAVRGEGLQAGLRPNPEASLSIENFGGIEGRASRGLAQSEATFALSQKLELGDKRAARVGLAHRNESVANLEFEAARLDLVRDAIMALAEVVAADRNAIIENDRLRLAGETLRAARLRVEAGKEALLQVRRTEVALATAEIAAERARQEGETARRGLALLLGVTRVELGPSIAWFEEIGQEPRAPQPPSPIDRLRPNPDIARLDAVVAQRRADVTLQRANGVPDVTVQGGVRRLQESRETAFVAGVSIPLPFNDRNQGGISRAGAELIRAEADAERGRQALIGSLLTAERRMSLAWRSADALKGSALQAASQAADFARIGYAEGKFGLLEVLEAQRALFEAKTQLNEALREFHNRRAEVERLRGGALGTQAIAGEK